MTLLTAHRAELYSQQTELAQQQTELASREAELAALATELESSKHQLVEQGGEQQLSTEYIEHRFASLSLCVHTLQGASCRAGTISLTPVAEAGSGLNESLGLLSAIEH